MQHKVFNTPEDRIDYYCGCKYDAAKKVDINSCNYKIRKNASRAKRIEWEHVVPAAKLGNMLDCWHNGGRKNCEDKSEEFNNREGDLHNLRPVIGEVNADRSDFLYNKTIGNFSSYGQCNFKIDFQHDIAEPPDNIKGDLARITLFIAEKYNLPFELTYVNMLKEWAIQDPVDEKEKIINEKIRVIQGDSNYYIDGSKSLK